MKFYKIVIGFLFLLFLLCSKSQKIPFGIYNFQKYLEETEFFKDDRSVGPALQQAGPEAASDGPDCIRIISYINNKVNLPLTSTTDLKKLCFEIPFQLRFDCFPETVPTVNDCDSRGCCFDDSVPMRDTSKIRNPLLPELLVEDPPTPAPMVNGPPICYFPKDYVSYNFTSVTQEAMGPSGVLRRYSDSGFIKDIIELKIDFLYETDTRIRVKIYDSLNTRYETPFPPVPIVESPSSNPLYSVTIAEESGGFAIIRNENGVPLFDTRGAGPLIFSDQFLQISSFLSSPYIYGLGQHLDGLLLDTYWYRRWLWAYDTGPKPYVNLYGSHPFYLNFENDGKSHGVFLLNSNGIDIILQPSPAISFRPIGGILDLYVFLGPTPSDVIQQYTDVIGKPFLPPYWSLGYHQCRYDYYTTNRTREIWQQTIDAGIPFDVQWNDIDSMDAFKDFTIDPVSYAGLSEFVDEVHSARMKYILVTDPGLDADEPDNSYFPYYNGSQEEIFIMTPDNQEFLGLSWVKNVTVWPDFTNPRAHELWEVFIGQFMEEVTFDGLWLDMNEPSNFDSSIEACNLSNPLNNPQYLPPNSEQSSKWLYYRTVCMDAIQKLGNHYDLHNLYGVLETVATSNALKAVRNKRPFVISRSSFPGHGTYAGHWTGDTSSRWWQLYRSIGDVINFNLFGVPMTGADICGFGENTTVPLCTRWYQVGAFYPFARNHNNEYCNDQDPVSLGEAVISSARNSLFERYRLLPFLYSLLFRSHLTGEPVMKPLFFEFYNDVQTYLIDSEFLWGEALLFTPVLLENENTVDVYIPKGKYYDWYNGALLVDSSGQYMKITVPDLYPAIYGRGGYVVPTQEPEVTTAASRSNPFSLMVFLDGNLEARGEIYWDDGDSIDTIEKSSYNFVKFDIVNQTLTNNVVMKGYDTEMTLGEVRITGVDTFNNCLVNGAIYLSCNYDSSNQVLFIRNLAGLSLTSSFTLSWN